MFTKDYIIVDVVDPSDLVPWHIPALGALQHYIMLHNAPAVGESSLIKVSQQSLEEVSASSNSQTPMQGYKDHEESE